MTAIKLARPLAEEIGILIAQLGGPIALGDGLTPDELRDLRTWLRAARERHWQELREARSRPAGGEVVNFERVLRLYAGHGDSPSDTSPDTEHA